MSFVKHSRPIHDFPGYTVSSDGRVFNRNDVELRQTPNHRGYPMVKLCDNGYEKNCSVHRLVAEAFVPKVEGKNVVNHIDGNKKNNDVSNLEWCTYSENMRHAYIHGLKRSYLTDEDRKLGSRISGDNSKRPVRVIETGVVYPSALDCSIDTGCIRSAISRCCNGLAKSHHGYHFEFADSGGSSNEF